MAQMPSPTTTFKVWAHEAFILRAPGVNFTKTALLFSISEMPHKWLAWHIYYEKFPNGKMDHPFDAGVTGDDGGLVYARQGIPRRPLARDFSTPQPVSIEEFGAAYKKQGTRIVGSKQASLFWPKQEARLRGNGHDVWSVQRLTLTIDLRIGATAIPLLLRTSTETVIRRPDEITSKGFVQFLMSERFSLDQRHNYKRAETMSGVIGSGTVLG
jgi:hypothetical protein